MTLCARGPLLAAAGFVVALGVAPLAAVGLAPLAAASPECHDVGSTMTYCETNGSTQLITTPPPWNVGGWYGGGGWPIYGGYGPN